MSISGHREHAQSARLAAGATRRRGARAVPLGTGAKVPEWMTDAWKRHVEAEARCKLKDRIHDIGIRR